MNPTCCYANSGILWGAERSCSWRCGGSPRLFSKHLPESEGNLQKINMSTSPSLPLTARGGEMQSLSLRVRNHLQTSAQWCKSVVQTLQAFPLPYAPQHNPSCNVALPQQQGQPLEQGLMGEPAQPGQGMSQHGISSLHGGYEISSPSGPAQGASENPFRRVLCSAGALTPPAPAPRAWSRNLLASLNKAPCSSLTAPTSRHHAPPYSQEI